MTTQTALSLIRNGKPTPVASVEMRIHNPSPYRPYYRLIVFREAGSGVYQGEAQTADGVAFVRVEAGREFTASMALDKAVAEYFAKPVEG